MIVAPERSARVAEIVGAAREILEREGPDGLTMRRLAEAMGIRAPSLYKHVQSKEDLEALLMAEAFRGMGAELHGVDHDRPARAGRRRRRSPSWVGPTVGGPSPTRTCTGS